MKKDSWLRNSVRLPVRDTARKYLIQAGHILFLFVLISAAAPVTLPAAEFTPLTDTEIAETVRRKLKANPLLDAEFVQVEINDKTVLLSGSVPDFGDVTRATQIAVSVRGVNNVVNEIEVSPFPITPDRQLRTQIRDTLAGDPLIESSRISVYVKNGDVTLTGRASSEEEKERIFAAAGNIAGAGKVNNLIFVELEPDEVTGDLDIALRIRNGFLEKGIGKNMDVSVHTGNVVLSGRAESTAEKAVAVSLAFVPGVRMVDAGRLTVDSPSRVLSTGTPLVWQTQEGGS